MRKISLPVAFVCVVALSLVAYAAKGPCAHQGVSSTTTATPNYNANGVLISVTEIVTETDKGSACLGINESDCTQTTDNNVAYSKTTTTIYTPNPDGTTTETVLPVHYDYGLKVC